MARLWAPTKSAGRELSANEPKADLKIVSRVALPSASYFSAVIGPVQEGLPLALAAGLITAFAMAFKLGHNRGSRSPWLVAARAPGGCGCTI